MKHGTESMYVNRKCRCPNCREASALARNKRRWKNIEAVRAYDRERKRKIRARA